ncbi:tRNA(Ser) Um(44) 2'-O-methyltransferase [Recurvomyces mirabilis]|uniref:tRNA (uracil-O(2)-)-methyltransferase n=1 Tax=Recurvomyces mirabilis TaxID=574656 RepID=A0AAE0TSZ6_9PEZI|nr:tRNA(Ser) Um(44) 2'-O-methyltransferase [Recurvomyces mirabilis]KAK5153466.1 tRNA(Ser) Um(44) 2'-O-methyltransferase [Recurvomyces mirabilis]
MANDHNEDPVANDPVSTPQPPHKSQAIDRTTTQPDLRLPDELWMTILEIPCSFPPEIFEQVMLNLIKNPNITSSHLFRADIFYDSGESGSHDGKPLYGYDLRRTMVRQLIPRNPQLDKALVQTCHLFQRWDGDEEVNVVLYIPHAQTENEMPFYHPAVSRVAFFHRWNHAAVEKKAAVSNGDDTPAPPAPGALSLSYALFPNTSLTPKLQRTALRLLQTIHKHGQGQQAGYKKRVHLDRIVPQKRYQDTYTRLKTKYGRLLAEQWVEVTDPGKHVFEDIGIAAFLVELWRNMHCPPRSQEGNDDSDEVDRHEEADQEGVKPQFPGFVDIGCGNGLLTFILLSEGYKGWGFDARERKTWSIFPKAIQEHLKQQLLVPRLLLDHHANNSNGNSTNPNSSAIDITSSWHDGTFPPETFIISNHADELTAWTPLLAYLNKSSFIAIPCCSHDLSGARFRAPSSTKSLAKEKNISTTPAVQGEALPDTRLPQQQQKLQNEHSRVDTALPTKSGTAETGSLSRTPAQKKMPSAYSSLCSYVGSLAEETGFRPQTEVLRIPSTRNLCIVGRYYRAPEARGHDRGNRTGFLNEEGEGEGDHDVNRRKVVVKDLVERELSRSLNTVSEDWIRRAEGLAKKPGSGH